MLKSLNLVQVEYLPAACGKFLDGAAQGYAVDRPAEGEIQFADLAFERRRIRRGWLV
jgi:hypothetical protein